MCGGPDEDPLFNALMFMALTPYLKETQFSGKAGLGIPVSRDAVGVYGSEVSFL